MTKDFFVHETSIIEEKATIGSGTKIWHWTHVMPSAKIGKDCSLGQNVYVGSEAVIGNNVKVQNNVSVYDKVILEDNVFCAPSCVFTNDPNPRAEYSHRDSWLQTVVKKGATIGANATVICGNSIGEYAFIGAGSVVTKDIPDYALAFGNPARIQGWMCQCGTKIDFGSKDQAKCLECNKEYKRISEDKIERK
ncbi:MAG: acyltransferase [Patescibacteria group bacterium]